MGQVEQLNYAHQHSNAYIPRESNYEAIDTAISGINICFLLLFQVFLSQ